MTPRVLMICGPPRKSDHIHNGFFAQAFRELGLDVIVYGPERPNYRADRARSDVIAEHRPDLLFQSASTAEQITTPIPRVFYYPDFHRLRDPTRLRDEDLIIVRAERYLELTDDPRVVFLPFSFNPAFLPPPTLFTERHRRVVFRGTYDTTTYPERTATIAALQRAELIDAVRYSGPKKGLPPEAYFHVLATNAIGLATGAIRINVAKEVEIAAAGCAVLTDNRGVGSYVSRDDCLVYRDPADAVQVVRDALNDVDRLAELAARTTAQAHAQHTDAVRTKQLAQLLRSRGLLCTS